MRVELEGKVVAITGAGGAIGSALAEGFARSGASVAICELNETTGGAAAQALQQAGCDARFFQLDVTRQASVEACLNEIADVYGGVDVWVNNAGINLLPQDKRPVQQFLESHYQRIMDVDLRGLVNCTRGVVPSMIARGKGNIINISSVGGLMPLRFQSVFVGAKAAVVALTRATAIDYAADNIRVNAIAPGSILFELTKGLFYADPEKTRAMTSHIPQGHPGNPEDVISAALFLASDDSNYVTGTTITVDGGWSSGFTRPFN